MAWLELLTVLQDIKSVESLIILTQLSFYVIAIYNLYRIKLFEKNNLELKKLTELQIEEISKIIESHDKELKEITKILYKIAGKLEIDA